MGLADAAIEAIALEKAIIEVIDTTEREELIRIAASNAQGGSGGAPAVPRTPNSVGVSDTLAGNSQALNIAAGSGSVLLEGAGLNPLDERSKRRVSRIRGAVARRFEVQFNPNTINISGSGGGMNMMTNFAGSGNGNNQQSGGQNGSGVSYGESKRHIEMSLQLTFDRALPIVTFPGDVAFLNITNAASAAGQTAWNSLKGKLDVQEEVEAFLAAMRNKNTRTVTFAWGKLIYSGYVNRIGAKYTLFNPSGKPVRATVDMTIVCTDEDVTPSSMGYWQEKFDGFAGSDRSYTGLNNNIVNLSQFG